MVGIQGIVELPKPAAPRRAEEKSPKSENLVKAVKDDVSFSREAQEAAAAKRAEAQQQAEAKIREEKVAEARQRIEQGTYTFVDVVREVATRMTGYVPD